MTPVTSREAQQKPAGPGLVVSYLLHITDHSTTQRPRGRFWSTQVARLWGAADRLAEAAT